MQERMRLRVPDSTRIDSAYIRSLVRTHEYNSQLVDRIRIVLASSARMLLEEQKREMIGDLLGTLADRLVPHFAREEEGGFLAAIVGLRPDWSGRVQRLKEEHATLIGTFRTLQDRSGQMELGALQQGVALAVDRYVAHEIEETELIRNLYV